MMLLAVIALAAGALAVEMAVQAAAGWRPEGIAEHAIAAAIAFALIASLIALSIPAARRALAPRQTSGLLLLAALAVSGALLEWGARRANDELSMQRRFHTRGPLVRRVHEPGGMHGIAGASHYTTDARGIRALEPPQPDDARWLAVGGSTTECVYLDDRETWAWAASEALEDVWIGNVGVSGFDTRQHLRFVETSPLLDGVEGIIVQPGVNDLWRYLADEEIESVFARFDGDPVTRTPRAELQDDAAKAKPGPVWTSSAMIQLYRTLRAPRRPPPQYEEGAGGAEYDIRHRHRADALKTDVLPDLSRGLNEYGDRIRRLIGAARDRGVDIVFTTQPVLWAAELPADIEARCWFGWLRNGDYLTVKRLREAMDTYNQRLREICADEETVCVELGLLQGNAEYFYDDCHFTEEGARVAGEAVARALRARLD
jgi:lysophospholipase L1-like esterase